MATKQITINSDLKLYKHQRDFIDGVLNNFKGSVHCCVSPRQCGKSLCVVVLLLKVALENKKTTSICVSPTMNQAEKLYKDLLTRIQGTPLIKTTNGVKLAITLINGSVILFKSAESDIASLQGYTCTGCLVIDEASFIRNDVFYAIQPWCRVHKAPIIMCSTPRFKSGFFYDFYQLGLEDGNRVFSYNWADYDLSALLTEEDKEGLRKQLPKQTYLCQVLGLFLDQEGSVFGEFSHVLGNSYTDGLNTYIGVDWGACTGNDETAIAVFNSAKQMIDLIHFNDKDETQTIEAVMSAIRKYKPLKVLVEKNSIGNIFLGLLRKAVLKERLGTRVIAFNTTNESKERLVNNLQVEIQNGTIQLLDDDDLTSELATYEMKLSTTGKKTYNAISGAHDDLVIATMLGLEATLAKQPTTMRFA